MQSHAVTYHGHVYFKIISEALKNPSTSSYIQYQQSILAYDYRYITQSGTAYEKDEQSYCQFGCTVDSQYIN